MLSPDIATRAMLVHHHSKTGRIDITSHQVMPVEQGKGFALGAGRAFSQHDKQTLVEMLLDEQPEAEFLPANLLVYGRKCLVWFLAPQAVEVPFEGERIEAPLPGLVFIATDGAKFRCFAFTGTDRPSAETPLYFAPLGNVYNDGSFCSGNVQLPREIRLENIPVWQRFVLESTNTHHGSVDPIQGCVGFAELVAFYRTLNESQAQEFPQDRLVPVMRHGEPVTVESVVKEGK